MHILSVNRLIKPLQKYCGSTLVLNNYRIGIYMIFQVLIILQWYTSKKKQQHGFNMVLFREEIVIVVE